MFDTNKIEQQAKDTGMALVLICLLVFLFSHQLASVYAAVFFLLVCMICPKLFQPAARVWFSFAHLLGGVVSKILLTIIFYTVLTPIGLLRKLTGADPMNLKKRSASGSAFTERNVTFIAADLEKPY